MCLYWLFYAFKVIYMFLHPKVSNFGCPVLEISEKVALVNITFSHFLSSSLFQVLSVFLWLCDCSQCHLNHHQGGPSRVVLPWDIHLWDSHQDVCLWFLQVFPQCLEYVSTNLVPPLVVSFQGEGLFLLALFPICMWNFGERNLVPVNLLAII